jgi:hypothetical protein
MKKAVSSILRAFLSLPLLVAAHASSQENRLQNFLGDWRGKGVIHELGDDTQTRRLTCRLSVRNDAKNRLVLKGRCGSPEGTRGFSTVITAAANGSLVASTRAVALQGDGYSSSGTLGAGGISLSGLNGNTSFAFRLSVPVSGQMEMHTAINGPKRNEKTSVIFNRREEQ